jgi:hypothetical protein
VRHLFRSREPHGLAEKAAPPMSSLFSGAIASERVECSLRLNFWGFLLFFRG